MRHGAKNQCRHQQPEGVTEPTVPVRNHRACQRSKPYDKEHDGTGIDRVLPEALKHPGTVISGNGKGMPVCSMVLTPLMHCSSARKKIAPAPESPEKWEGGNKQPQRNQHKGNDVAGTTRVCIKPSIVSSVRFTVEIAPGAYQHRR